MSIGLNAPDELGTQLCWVPHETTMGNQICICHGAPPIVIRLVGDGTLQLLGRRYMSRVVSGTDFKVKAFPVETWLLK